MKTQGSGNSELCPTEGARQRTNPSRLISSPAQELLTWRHGAAACTAEGAAAAASPERPWPCGLCAGQVRLAPAQAKLLRLRPRGGTRRAGARRRVERARGGGRNVEPAPPRPAPRSSPTPARAPHCTREASAHRIAPGGSSTALPEPRTPRPLHCCQKSGSPDPPPAVALGCQQTGSSTCLPGAQATRTEDL